jgi:hypothetical protein
MPTTISDLQTLYTNSGADSNSGNTVIQQQINYITNLKNYIDYLNQGLQINGCIDVARGTLGNATALNCNTSNISCNPICSNITTYYDKIKSGGTDYVNFNTYSTVESTNTNYNDIMTNNKKIQDLRNELDLKLKDLNRTPDSRFQKYEDNYNYELMMNITWSILATSIIYYVFAKL